MKIRNTTGVPQNLPGYGLFDIQPDAEFELSDEEAGQRLREQWGQVEPAPPAPADPVEPEPATTSKQKNAAAAQKEGE